MAAAAAAAAAAMSNDGTLPQEIITDILSRLSVKSLCRFKCVSPSWKSLISNPHFAKTHLNRTKTLNHKNLDRKILIMAYELYSVDFTHINPTATKLDFPTAEQRLTADGEFQVLSSCDGLALVSHQQGSELFLLNPSTRECKELPICPFVPNSGCSFYTDTFGVGYDSFTDDYKVVMVSPAFQSAIWCGTSIVVVYSVKTDAWRRIQDTNLFLAGHAGRVFVNGCLYTLCGRVDSNVIVAFNLSDEIIRDVPQPASFQRGEIGYYQFAVLGGCLCLVDSREPAFWKMKEYGVRESWTRFKIRSGNFLDRLLCLLVEDDFLLRTTAGQFERLDVYNARKDTARDLVICGIPHKFSFEGIYVESLISPNHGGQIGRQ